MSLKLMYITNSCTVARVAEESGVDWIFVDLETLGKEERQKGMDSVKSHHTVEDIVKLRGVLKRAKLLIRIDPIHSETPEQIERIVAAGADIIMLPMWKESREVARFLELVGGRCRTILLLETREAEAHLNEVVTLPGIDMVYIGLNDLHLSYHKRFMFELLADGTVERICRHLHRNGIPYGFGGIGQIGGGLLPAQHILGEHIRLGSDMVILSRSFCNTEHFKNLDEIEALFRKGVRDLRMCEEKFRMASDQDLEKNRQKVCSDVSKIVIELKEEKLTSVSLD